MHSSGPLIAMVATKFNCFPLAKEVEQINSLEEEIRVFLLHKYHFLAAEKYNAQGCKIAKAKTPSALEPCPYSCKSSSICHVDKNESHDQLQKSH